MKCGIETLRTPGVDSKQIKIVLFTTLTIGPKILNAYRHIVANSNLETHIVSFNSTLLGSNQSICLLNKLQSVVVNSKTAKGKQYVQKLMLPWISLPYIRDSRLLVLDNDLVLRRRPEDMLDSLQLGHAAVGLVREQGFLMSKHLNTTAFNGGVQLLDLPRMRNSLEYVDELENIANNQRDFKGLSRFGDQTIYSLIAKRYPHLFKRLGCQWNRQVGSWLYDAGSYGRFKKMPCDDCVILHINDPGIKSRIYKENHSFYNMTNLRRLLKKHNKNFRSAFPCFE